MERIISSYLLLLLLTFSYIQVESRENGYITAEISNRGLEFLKDLLIQEAESSLVPLELPRIEKAVKIPIIGNVQIAISNIVIERIDVTSSTLQTGDSGIVIDVAGATANLSMNWEYSYSTWLLPISLSDNGNATVQVEGLEVGLTLSLETVGGSLRLSPLECGCYVGDISIRLNGGASWLYQGFIDAFEGKISSAVEDAIPEKIKEAIVNLDSLLQSLPKELPVTNIAAMNVTFVDDLVLNKSSLRLKIDGLFSETHKVALPTYHHRLLSALVSTDEAEKMVKISVHEDVIKSASAVYFEANKMVWTVDKVPDQSLLNTAGWKFIIPQLYKKYPNHDMNLNLSVSSLPTIEVEEQQVRVVVPLDVVINVLEADEIIPVVCISTVISSSTSAEISRNAVVGVAKLNSFTMSLKWSKIGSLHMHLIQTLVSTVMRTVVFPYLNLQLDQGYPIPVFHGYTLKDAGILLTDNQIVVGTDVAHVC
ncbi:putative BPI/LBP family protein At1g04970 [Andrographis paniculata]|uniref:putative BPI/LBP family protein At1g04970 n=1 Tax=Andrographis paniculata TaxID=175694 RepID=UPI0021E89C8B|nr:putative BPI/LBP family protein At1g04970 [Andrographis paniculata]